MKQLSKEAFSATMQGNMTNVTQNYTCNVDIWPQVKELADQQLVDEAVYNNKKVLVVYRNEDKTYDHILLPTNKDEHYIVIVLDIVHNAIEGYYYLNLQKEDGVKQ